MRSRRGRTLWPGATLLGSAAVIALVQSCAHPPPRVDRDPCGILAERADWRDAVRSAGARWSVAPGVLLAVIHQESRFRPRARPWWRLLGLPLAPASSAYGYSQATDGTWRDYLRATGRRAARRDDFSDAVDFVGWYADVIHRVARVPKDDAYHLYLAYHEGPAGFARGSHLGKAWLLDVARRVEAHAAYLDPDGARCGASSAAISRLEESGEPGAPQAVREATAASDEPQA